MSDAQPSMRFEADRMTVDFHGAELEPFQLALLETLNVTPVNYVPIGAVRETVRLAVRDALKDARVGDPLAEKARRWLNEGCSPPHHVSDETEMV